nr:hypothetical protein [Clostridium sp. Marseille-P7770]
MLNKEKFAKEIVELAVNVKDVGVVNGKPCSCSDTFCADCDFHCDTCTEELKEWANSEYKELEIDWERVPVDTPVLVWDFDDRAKRRRYYAGRNGIKFMAFDFGATSWSCDEKTSSWFNCELARKEDIKKYRKR